MSTTPANKPSDELAENIIRLLNNDLLNATDKSEMLARLAPNTVEVWSQTILDINQLIDLKAKGYDN